MIAPDCPWVEGDRNLLVGAGEGEDYEVVTDVVPIRGDGKVVPVGGEHRQQLPSFMFGEVENSDVGLEFVPSGWETLAVDRTSTSC